VPAPAWIFFNLTPVTSSSVRHTVGADATDPSTPSWWRSTSMSAIASRPSASITATSAMHQAYGDKYVTSQYRHVDPVTG